MTPPPENLLTLARKIAAAHKLDPALVCAVIEQESAWNPWAIRFEPEFERKYIHPALPSAPTTEELCLAVSWGLMQVMGQTAREHGFQGRFLSHLCQPETGLTIGCCVLASKCTSAQGNIEKALLLWNGGANKAYPAQVTARMTKYREVRGLSASHSLQ